MLKFLLGAAVGYVLGAKAGHERYEQLKRTYQRVSDHPAVQGAAGVVRAQVEGRGRGDHAPLSGTTETPAFGSSRSERARPRRGSCTPSCWNLLAFGGNRCWR